MTALARGLFAALVVATFAAFFVAQRLKSQPPAIQQLGVFPYVSPNGDGRHDWTRITFSLKRDDRVDVAILDTDGDVVRDLVSGRGLDAGEQLQVNWDGRDDEGRAVRDGTYRPRLVLRRQGRAVDLPRTIRVDTRPPRPRVMWMTPRERRGPQLMPTATGEPVRIRVFVPGRRESVEIWKTDGTPRRVVELELTERVRQEASAYWDGTVDGRRVSPGTYVAVVQSRDRAGNIGSSVPRRVLEGRARRGDTARGLGGITVRYLGAQPPMLPVRGGGEFTVGVDARGETFNWNLRRVGDPVPYVRSRRATGGPLTRRMPAEESGLILFEARTRTRSTRVPIAVDDRDDNPVLVVLPATTWQGRNSLDDDGDGLPNTLRRGVPVELGRILAGGLPLGMTENEGPLMAALDRQPGGYDLTTDVALAAGRGPRLDGHRGVLLAGDTVWLTEDVQRRLRRFVVAGGTLASFGTRSLRAEVRQTNTQLLDATPIGRVDLFGARLAPIRRETVDVSILVDDPSLQLFAGGEGLFPGVEAWEATASVGPEARLLSSAVTPDGREVIVAARFGRGLVIRPGIPGFATRVGGDRDSAELLGRIWTLLRAG